MGLTSFQRARRITNLEGSYDEATNQYLGVDKPADEAGKTKKKAKADEVFDYDTRRPASIGEGKGDNNKGESPIDEADYTGLTYSEGEPGDNQKTLPENQEALETDAPVKKVDETLDLLKLRSGSKRTRSKANENDADAEKSESSGSSRERKDGQAE